MNAHDPLCACYPNLTGAPCHCELIARARADEREQAAQRVAAVHYINSGQPVMVARMRAIEAARGEQP